MSDKSESDRDRENGSGSPPISGSPGESGSPSASLQHVHHGNFNHGASSSSSDVNSEIGYPVAEHDIAEKTPSPVEAKYIPDLEVELALRIRGIEIGVPLMTPKIAHGLYQPGIDKECMIKTNLFGLKVKNGVIFQYHIEFKKPKDGDKTILLFAESERKPSDYFLNRNRQLYGTLMNLFILKYPDFFIGGSDSFCYDLNHQLLSIEKLDIEKMKTGMFLTSAELPESLTYNQNVYLEVAPAGKDNSIILREFITKPEADLSKVRTEMKQSLELATSRFASQDTSNFLMYESHKSFYLKPQKVGLECVNLGNGKYLNPGAFKSVSVVEGPNINRAAGIIIDTVNSPFYEPNNLLDTCMKKINNTCFSIHGTQNDELRTFISGKVVFTNYGNQQTRPYTISGLNNESAVTQTFQTEDGKQTTVNNYYRQRYQINLQYPEWPLAEVKSKGKLLYFPLETLNIADYQKVKPCDITSEDTAAMVKACAVPPSEKQRQINIAHASFGINDDPFCKKLGLETVDEPMILKARTLGAPKIQYSGGSSTPGADGKWILPRGQFTYLKTCSIKKWAYVVIESGRIVFDHNGFIRAFMNEAKNRGITVDPPDYVFTFESQHFYQQDFEKIFYESRSYNYEFLLFLHEKHVGDTFHDSIKAFERSSSIITQCVNIPTAFKILNQNSRLTLENIVAKTNVKLGGLNYDLIPLSPYHPDQKLLVIGIALNHPGGGFREDPNHYSIVGFSANDGKHPGEFFGNFYFQPTRRNEIVHLLDEMLQEVLDRYHENRGGFPSSIVIYRTGVEEGLYPSVLRYEVPLIEDCISKKAPNVPFTLIAANKQHNFRMTPEYIDPRARAVDQNVRPGTIIDTHAVHPVFNQFYLVSHLAIQGTAKPVKYTVLQSTEDEKDLSMDKLERLTNDLTHKYQIVKSPVSFPAPVRVADDYAKRGRQIYKILYRPPSEHSGSPGPEEAESANVYLAESQRYNFTHRSVLRNKRTNA